MVVIKFSVPRLHEGNACLLHKQPCQKLKLSSTLFAPAGTTRLQLSNKGDKGQYTDFANIVVAFAFLTIPIIGWLLDKKVRNMGKELLLHWTVYEAASVSLSWP